MTFYVCEESKFIYCSFENIAGCCVDASKDIAHIEALYVQEKYRNQKYGWKLLMVVLELLQKKGFQFADLEDSTTRCRKSNNIYTKAGFIYVNDEKQENCNLMRIDLRSLRLHDKYITRYLIKTVEKNEKFPGLLILC